MKLDEYFCDEQEEEEGDEVSDELSLGQLTQNNVQVGIKECELF